MGQADGGDAGVPQRPVEGFAKLRVAVAGEDAAAAQAGHALKAGSLLCDPPGVGVLGARGRDRSPRGDVNEDEQVRILPALHCQHPLLDEVARPERLGVGSDELDPLASPRLGTVGRLAW